MAKKKLSRPLTLFSAMFLVLGGSILGELTPPQTETTGAKDFVAMFGNCSPCCPAGSYGCEITCDFPNGISLSDTLYVSGCRYTGSAVEVNYSFGTNSYTYSSACTNAGCEYAVTTTTVAGSTSTSTTTNTSTISTTTTTQPGDTTTTTTTTSSTTTTSPVCNLCCVPGTYSCDVLCEGTSKVNKTDQVYYCSYDNSILDFSDESGSITMECINAACGTIVTTSTTTSTTSTSTTHAGETTTTTTTTSSTTTTKALTKCWDGSNERLPKSSLHMRKFCKCVIDVYDYEGYLDISGYHTAYRFTNNGNNLVWTTSLVGSAYEPLIRVQCSDLNWYETSRDYYYRDNPDPYSPTTTTTLATECPLDGDHTPCGTVSMEEVLDYISLWLAGQTTLQELMALLDAWIAG